MFEPCVDADWLNIIDNIYLFSFAVSELIIR